MQSFLPAQVEIEGAQHLADLSGPAVVVANRVSALDAHLLARHFPRRLRVHVGEHQPAQGAWWCRSDAVSRLPTTAEGLKQLLDSGAPEGALPAFLPAEPVGSRGGIGKISDLAMRLADRQCDSTYVPVAISWQRHGWRPRAKITICAPRRLEQPATLERQQLREWRESQLRLLLEEALFASIHDPAATMPGQLLAGSRVHGGKELIYKQVIPERRQIDYKLLLRGVFALGADLGRSHQLHERVGLMLPTALGSAVAFHACHAAGIVPVMLNFGAGRANLVSACQTAQIKVVYTSRALLDKLEAARDGADGMAEAGCEIRYLEDLRDNLSLGAKLGAVLGMLAPALRMGQLPGARLAAADEAVVLFTSGSEGPPKGVVLSHGNLVANAHQVLVRLSLEDDDLLFCCLPTFHSFGMIAGLVLPPLAGLPTLMFPSPLMYHEIPAVIEAERATIMFSTSTFYAQYGRCAHPSDFNSLRLVIAGGEKLRDNVYEQWLHDFGLRIYEGYGVTETSPAVSVNVAYCCKKGTIGLPLPGIEYRIRQVEGVDEGGELHVNGLNVMTGYMFADDPGTIVPPRDGWHETGDIASVDHDGFIRIVGRIKRFAKVAGEMVPLSRVEEVVEDLIGEGSCAALAVADEKRGESIVLLTTNADIERAAVVERVVAAGLPELWAPRRIEVVDEIPLLPTGKTDYPAAAALLAAKEDA